MHKQDNILDKALAKLKAMEKQLLEETSVLGEIREKENAYLGELETFRLEADEKNRVIAALNEEIKTQRAEQEKLTAELAKRSAEFNDLTTREREEFRTADGKTAMEFSLQVKKLLNELHAAQEQFNLKTAETNRCLNDLETARAEISRNEPVISSLREEVKNNRGLTLRLEKEQTRSAEAEKQLKDEIGLLKETMVSRNSEAESLALDLKDKKEKIYALKKELDSSLSTANTSRERIIKEDADREKELVAGRRDIKEKLNSRNAEMEKFHAEFSLLQDKHKLLKGEHDTSLSRLNELDAANQRLSLALKKQEDLYKNDVGTVKLDLAGKEQLLAAIREEIKGYKEENGRLTAELQGKAAEFRAMIEKERNDSRLTRENTEKESAGTEKELLNELLNAKEDLNHKNTEMERLKVDLKNLGDMNDIAGKELSELRTSLQNSGLRLKEKDNELLKFKAEFRAMIEKEREDFRLARENTEKESAGTEKELLNKLLNAKEDLNHKSTEMERLKVDLKNLGDMNDIAGKELSELRASLQNSGLRLKEKDNELLKFKTVLDRQKSELDGNFGELHKKNEQLKKTTVELELLKGDMETASDKAQNEKDALKAALLAEIHTLKETISHKTLETDKLKLEIQDIKDENEILKGNLQSRLIGMTEQNVLSKSSRSALREKEDELRSLREKLEELTKESNTRLEELNAKKEEIRNLSARLKQNVPPAPQKTGIIRNLKFWDKGPGN